MNELRGDSRLGRVNLRHKKVRKHVTEQNTIIIACRLLDEDEGERKTPRESNTRLSLSHINLSKLVNLHTSTIFFQSIPFTTLYSVFLSYHP